MTQSAQQDRLPVRTVRWIGSGVFELQLERKDLPFSPGDCLALYAADGRVSRPYSIASGTGEDVLRFLIRRMPDGVVSGFLSERAPGDEVRVSPPFGWFRPGEHAELRPYVCIATGTGIAPFLCRLRSDSARPPHMILYGVRDAEDLYDPEWLAAQCDVRIAVSREDAPGVYHGRVTGLLDMLPDGKDIDYYLCGLDAMIDEVTDHLEGRGVAITRIHRECFFNASIP